MYPIVYRNFECLASWSPSFLLVSHLHAGLANYKFFDRLLNYVIGKLSSRTEYQF